MQAKSLYVKRIVQGWYNLHDLLQPRESFGFQRMAECGQWAHDSNVDDIIVVFQRLALTTLRSARIGITAWT